MVKVVFGRRPFWWTMVLVAIVTAALLYALNSGMRASGLYAAPDEPAEASRVILVVQIAANVLIIAIAGAVAWILAHRHRKAQAKLRDAFQ